jgi:hypothetical protein
MTIKVQEKRRREYRASISGPGKTSYQKKYDKAMSGRDPEAAIAAKCLDCMYWQRSRIAECPIVCCPLWLYRPFTSTEMREAAAAPKKSRKVRRPKSSPARRPRRTAAATRKRK